MAHNLRHKQRQNLLTTASQIQGVAASVIIRYESRILEFGQ
jgi:hypothetical protein